MRGVRYTVLKNPGKLTDRRSEASGNLRDTDPQGPALPFMAAQGTPPDAAQTTGDQARTELNRRVFRASHSRIPEIVEPARKIRRHGPDILRTTELGCSNARLEASDNRIKVTIRMAYGFHHANNPIALIMLRRGGLDIRPPQPRTQPTKTAEASYVLDISAQRGRCNRSITV